MKYRQKMTPKASRRDFTKKAMKVSTRNFATVMRGGYRL